MILATSFRLYPTLQTYSFNIGLWHAIVAKTWRKYISLL